MESVFVLNTSGCNKEKAIRLRMAWSERLVVNAVLKVFKSPKVLMTPTQNLLTRGHRQDEDWRF